MKLLEAFEILCRTPRRKDKIHVRGYEAAGYVLRNHLTRVTQIADCLEASTDPVEAFTIDHLGPRYTVTYRRTGYQAVTSAQSLPSLISELAYLMQRPTTKETP